MTNGPPPPHLLGVTRQLDTGAVEQKISVPADAVPQVGGINISTSSSAMQRLQDPARYLVSYPFQCSEQLSARILGLANLKLIVKMFPAAIHDITPEQIDSILQEDVNQLLPRQTPFGAFSMWGAHEQSELPFVSIQCAKALAAAQKAGISVPPAKMDRCKQYLSGIVSWIPQWYSDREKLSLRSYALNVRHQNGEDASSEAIQVVKDAIRLSVQEREQLANDRMTLKPNPQVDLARMLPLDAMAWLWPILSKDDAGSNYGQIIRNLISAHINETSSTAYIQDNLYGENAYLMFYSSSRASAVVPENMIDSEPSSDLIPKLVKGLLLGMSNGRFSNTQENCCALVALTKYFTTFEKQPPEFTALAWIGNKCVMKEQFVGRSLDVKSLAVPMNYLQAHAQDDTVILQKDGAGRMYYRIGLKYASKDPHVRAASQGFAVSRTYEATDDPAAIERNTDGSLHVKPGSTLKVTIKIDAPGTRYYVALTDPLPAGFEALNGSLKGTRDAASSSSGGRLRSFRQWGWFEHENMRDTRTEAFTSKMPAGHYEYTYFARATTPGAFIVPPCKVEEMYTPETFGRTATDQVVIH